MSSFDFMFYMEPFDITEPAPYPPPDKDGKGSSESSMSRRKRKEYGMRFAEYVHRCKDCDSVVCSGRGRRFTAGRYDHIMEQAEISFDFQENMLLAMTCN